MTLLYVLLIDFAAIRKMTVAQPRQFFITNNCAETVWVAGAGNRTPVFSGSSGGLDLPAGSTVTASLPTPRLAAASGDVVSALFDANGKGSCQTGDFGGLWCQHAGAGTTIHADGILTGSPSGAVFPEGGNSLRLHLHACWIGAHGTAALCRDLLLNGKLTNPSMSASMKRRY